VGLSFYDAIKLIELLENLVKEGNSVIIIEHDPMILSYADYLIELGPEGGPKGGEVIAQGTPKDLMKNKSSKTGPYLS
jgi:excinuclease ABC subunit A